VGAAVGCSGGSNLLDRVGRGATKRSHTARHSPAGAKAFPLPIRKDSP